jgi:hypothetical protein
MIRLDVLGVVCTGFLGACVAAPGTPDAPPEPLRVTNGDAPFAYDQGATARDVAEATCTRRGQRLQSSIYDRYEAGTWVFVEGCA